MNYYERYCGDYQRDTAHLSLAEHGAYTILLDTYYATERPLPADYASLFRICRAMSKPEQDAVRAVVDQFFPLAEDGLRHNSRADIEIADAQPRIAAAKVNGSKGGRPRKGNPAGNPDKTQQKPGGFPNKNPVANPEETQHEPSSKALHTPYTGTNVPDALASPEQIIFGAGIQILIRAGVSEPNARTFLGKHIKTDKTKLAEVIGYLAANPKIEPRAYIEAAMKPKERGFVC